jgi:hypothetical protein
LIFASESKKRKNQKKKRTKKIPQKHPQNNHRNNPQSSDYEKVRQLDLDTKAELEAKLEKHKKLLAEAEVQYADTRAVRM